MQLIKNNKSFLGTAAILSVSSNLRSVSIIGSYWFKETLSQKLQHFSLQTTAYCADCFVAPRGLITSKAIISKTLL